jgi:nucleoside 2-deoxyribosyltransferase
MTFPGITDFVEFGVSKYCVYIAGPYTNGDTVINVRRAIEAAENLWDAGFTPYIPHLTMFWHFMNPHTYEFWLEYDLEWLSKCDILLRLSGESLGADKEVKFAQEKGIPVCYSVREVSELNH